MSGHTIYPQDDQKIPEELYCTYCGLVLNKPVETSETGLRFCNDCFDKAAKSPADRLTYGIDAEDIPMYKEEVKEQIATLKVKCENYNFGCDWKGLFKKLMDHLHECQYVSRECPDCGWQVPLIEMNNHIKNECFKRLIRCEHCDQVLYFMELPSHTKVCHNVPRMCRNCKKEMPRSQLIHHMYNNCGHVTCVCKDDNSIYQVDSTMTEFRDHLQDVSKLADHLVPVICEVTKMSEAFKEITKKLEMHEKRNNFLEKKVEQLEKKVVELKVKSENKANLEASSLSNVLTKTPISNGTPTVYASQAVFHQTTTIQYRSSADTANASCVKAIEDRLSKLEHDIQFLQEQLNSCNAKAYVDQVCQYDAVLLAYKARISELEQLSMFTYVAANGDYLWHIPEVSKARSSLTACIQSPPFLIRRIDSYKMCIRAYLNGTGSGDKTHLSVFFVLMKGKYDPLLQWPFKSKVSLILVNQDTKKNVVQTFKPDPQSSAFQRPTTDMNDPIGSDEFATLSVLDDTGFVKDDVMYIKAIVS